MKAFLKLHRADGKFHSHVAMGDFKGRFNFSRPKFEDLWLTYGDGRNPSTLGLAEKQQNYAPFLVDVDLSHTTEQSLYSQTDVEQLVRLCQNILYEKVEGLTQEMLLGIYLSKDPYYDTQKGKWKHGIHLHFPHIFLDIESLKQLTRHISNIIQETNIFPLFTDKASLIDERVHNVPWLLYGSAKEGKAPYLFNTAYDFKLKSISLEKAFKNYVIYNSREKPIDIKGKVDEYLPRILSVIPNNRKVFNLKPNAFPKPKAPVFKLSEEEKTDYDEIDPEDQETEIMVRQLMSLIGDYHADDYMDWLKCGWILHNIFKGNDTGLTIYKEFSSRCEDKYDETNVSCMWEKIVTDGRVGIGTLKFWAKLDSPQLYSSVVTKLPQDVQYKECENMEIDGFGSVSYIDLLNKYDTVFVKGNMGCGKTEKIKSLIPLYDKIVFVSCKRSLAYDFHNKYPEFKLYNDKDGLGKKNEDKQHIDIDIHKKVIVQIDSIGRLIGKVDLFIVDEFIDLSSQVLQSKCKTEAIDSFQVHLEFSGKRLIMDANLDRIDYFSSLLNFEKSIFVKDKKIYHNDKHLIIEPNKEQFISDICAINMGRMFIPSDSKKFIDNVSKKYKDTYPERKVLILTSDSSENDKKQDWKDYDVIFCSPTITAGVSHKDKIDHVYGFYCERSTNAWSSTQQLLRCRNWKEAHICFGNSNMSKSNLPVNDVDIEKAIATDFEKEMIGNIKYNRIKKTIDKTFVYYMYIEDKKKDNRSQKFFKYYFIKIMKEHGIKITTSKVQVDKNVIEEVKLEMKRIEYKNKDDLINAIAKAEPTDEDITNFKAGNFDNMNKATYEAILMTETFEGFKPKTKEEVGLYIDEKLNYYNICRKVRGLDKPEELSGSNYSALDIKEQKNIRRRDLAYDMLTMAGFTGFFDKSAITINDKLKTFVRDNVDDIQVFFNSYKTINLESDKALMTFINSKLESVYGVKMVGKDKQSKGQRFKVYTIDGMDKWAEFRGEDKPSITGTLKPLLRSN
jgi:hypothetical protein